MSSEVILFFKRRYHIITNAIQIRVTWWCYYPNPTLLPFIFPFQFFCLFSPPKNTRHFIIWKFIFWHEHTWNWGWYASISIWKVSRARRNKEVSFHRALSPLNWLNIFKNGYIDGAISRFLPPIKKEKYFQREAQPEKREISVGFLDPDHQKEISRHKFILHKILKEWRNQKKYIERRNPFILFILPVVHVYVYLLLCPFFCTTSITFLKEKYI